MPKENSFPRYYNPTVAGATRAMALLVQTTEPMNVTDIARKTGLTRGTALRVMRTLAAEEMVTDVGGARYVMGPAYIRQAFATASRLGLRASAHSVLADLTENTGETSHVIALTGREGVVVAVHDSQNALRVTSRLGTVVKLHASSGGKAILAALPMAQCKALCEKLDYERRTPYTCDSNAVLQENLKEVRAQGYAVENEEYYIGVRSLAAALPVQSGFDGGIIAIGITSATVRFARERVPEIATMVLSAARRLSECINTSA